MPGGMGGLMSLLTRGGIGPSGGQPQREPAIVDEYDVARWQRADGLDAAAPTMVQAVRADWEKKKFGREKRTPVKRLQGRFSRKKEPEAPAAPDPRPVSGTVATPEMKKAAQRPEPVPAQSAAVEPMEPEVRTAPQRAGERNYLGLTFQTQLGGFFAENPVNSALLAADSLSLGPLALNQVLLPRGRTPAPPPEYPRQDAAQGGDRAYMDEFHQGREERKYQVRIL